MAKLIDKDALVAEIEKLEKMYCYDNKTNSGLVAISIFENINNVIDKMKEVNFKNVKSVFEGQYLTKDKVVTTIERLQDECEEQGDNNGVELLEKLFNKLDVLEVKEVDLEKELDTWRHNHFHGRRDIFANGEYLERVSQLDIAKYFFELGLKTKQTTI